MSPKGEQIVELCEPAGRACIINAPGDNASRDPQGLPLAYYRAKREPGGRARSANLDRRTCIGNE